MPTSRQQTPPQAHTHTHTHINKQSGFECNYTGNAKSSLALVCHLPADFSSLPLSYVYFCVFCASLAVCAPSGESSRSKL